MAEETIGTATEAIPGGSVWYEGRYRITAELLGR